MPDFKVLPTVNGTDVSLDGHTHGTDVADAIDAAVELTPTPDGFFATVVAGVLNKINWPTIETYLGGLYLLLAGGVAQTVTGVKTFTDKVIFEQATYPIALFIRLATIATGVRTAFSVRTTTSVDMTDGLATGISFELNDDTLTGQNIIADIIAKRSGADINGKLEFRTALAGVLSSWLTIDENGLLRSIGDTILSTKTAIGKTTAPIYPMDLRVGTDQNFMFHSSGGVARVHTVNDANNALTAMIVDALTLHLQQAGLPTYVGGDIGIGTTDIETSGANFGVIQLGLDGQIMYGKSGGVDGLWISQNAYHDGSVWRRRTANASVLVQFFDGNFYISTAPTGAANVDLTSLFVTQLVATPTALTLTAPTIADHTNATHTHTTNAQGGDLSNVFLRVNGPSTAGGSADVYRFMADVIDVTSTQQITIDVTTPTESDQQIRTVWEFSFGRNSNSGCFCIGKFEASWTLPVLGGAGLVHSYEGMYDMSGTPSNVAVIAITNGVRLILDSTSFTNTLNENMVIVTSIGTEVNNSLTHTVTIT
jgi:hypothetical protein